jgi:hypothetical protein
MSASQALQRSAVAAVDAVLPLAGASAVYADNPAEPSTVAQLDPHEHGSQGADALLGLDQGLTSFSGPKAHQATFVRRRPATGAALSTP